jgi:hypothetical protein
MEYTKGEWKRKGNVISVDDEFIIAKLPPPLDGGAKEFIDNARLIASAPALYEALKIAFDWLKEEYPSASPNKIMAESLRKAEGYTI